MNTIKQLAAIGLALVIFTGCTRNAVTGRKQLTLVSGQDMMASSLTQYSEFLKTNKVVTNTSDAEMVKRVGARISAAITQYYTAKGLGKVLDGYQWEYNLIDSKEVNAWCMPGGKIVVYTSLLPITQDEPTLAVVMGHEIAHAVAEHGRERVSEQLLTQTGSQVFSSLITSDPQKAQNIFKLANGLTTFGITLPHSRKQELEADKFGLLYCAMAGYDPRTAIPLWERMQKLSAGQAPPEFASTHPAESTRIDKLKEQMPEALTYYEQAKAQIDKAQTEKTQAEKAKPTNGKMKRKQ